ncbi:MAG: M15 family metallopeptidase, partial [Arenicella sp.]|nr:M15 family metallopeptidase [Arenicella sp.]
MRDQDTLDQRTKRNLVGVHRALQIVVERTPVVPGYQMCVTEGLRDMQRQAELLKTGASTTMNSRHLTGHAFDFAMFDNKKAPPDDFVKKIDPAYREQWKLFREIAAALDIEIVWGGNWSSIADGTHVQLS